MIIQPISATDVSSLEFSTVQKKAPKDAKAGYVNNKELQAAFVIYWEKKKAAIAAGLPNPPLSETIGKAILDIANRRTYSKNFIGYTQSWKEEMVDDAIETCVRYAHNYNPEKYNNPFAYITQLVTNSIIQRIKIEKAHTYIKYKSFDLSGGFNAIADEHSDIDGIHIDETTEMYRDYLTYISDYEEKNFSKKPKDDVEEFMGVLDFLEEIDE